MTTRSTAEHLSVLNPWAAIALVSATVGLVAAIPVLPDWFRGLCLFFFVFTGPGAALCAWMRLPGAVSGFVLTATGPVMVVLYSTLAAQYGGWHPVASVILLATACLAAALARWWVARRDARGEAS